MKEKLYLHQENLTSQAHHFALLIVHSYSAISQFLKIEFIESLLLNRNFMERHFIYRFVLEDYTILAKKKVLQLVYIHI